MGLGAITPNFIPRQIQNVEAQETAAEAVSQRAVQEIVQDLKEVLSAVRDANLDLKEEVTAGVTKRQLSNTKDEGLHGTIAEQKQQALQRTQEMARQEQMQFGKQNQNSEAIKEEMAAFLATDEVDRKTKAKKTKFEERLEKLARLKDVIDVNQLSGEDKQVVEEFLGNLNTIQNKRGELKRLESQEVYYEELLEKKKEQDERDRQRQQAQEKKD
ncbi:MAG: hypothetical protein AB7F28_07720 [Candidatus Margulisiibacteriota bacterium]